MDWKIIDDIDPKPGEMYLCMDSDGGMYVLHFCIKNGDTLPKWYSEDSEFGLSISHEPGVATLINPDGAWAIYKNPEIYRKGEN